MYMLGFTRRFIKNHTNDLTHYHLVNYFLILRKQKVPCTQKGKPPDMLRRLSFCVLCLQGYSFTNLRVETCPSFRVTWIT
jgi:hypothetical protein